MSQPNFVIAPDGWERPKGSQSDVNECLHQDFCHQTHWCIECGISVTHVEFREEAARVLQSDVDLLVAAIDRLTDQAAKMCTILHGIGSDAASDG